MEAAKAIQMFPISNRITENKETGFVPIYRSIKEHWLWKESRVKTKFEAWLDLLLMASHDNQKEPVGYDLIMVKEGQVLTSQLALSLAWAWDRSAVRGFLTLLERDRMISVKSTTKFTMITICNYASYRAKRPTKQQQLNNASTTLQHIQPLEPLKEDSTPPAKPVVWVYCHNGFFDRQIEANKQEPEIGKYQKLVEFLHTKDSEGDALFANVLKIQKQISYKDYLQLKEVERSSKRTLKSVLEGIENYTPKKPYKNLFLTAKHWLETNFE